MPSVQVGCVARVSHLQLPMSATILYLIRHAHTNANELSSTAAMAGWTDIPLSDLGEAQLACIRERLEIRGADLVIYSSDLTRARRTAEAVGGGRAVRSLRSLREISCGIVDGWLVNDVRSRFPELWQQNESQIDAGFAWPGGESYAEFRARVLRALGGIAARHAGGRVIVVTHAGVIAQAVGTIRGTSPAGWAKWRPGNCSVTTVAWEDRPRLVDFDSREHLDITRAGMRRHGE